MPSLLHPSGQLEEANCKPCKDKLYLMAYGDTREEKAVNINEFHFTSLTYHILILITDNQPDV
jgi:hypothetical protein